MTVVARLPFPVSTGTISFSNTPRSRAAAARCCESIAYSSCTSREILRSFAMFSAVFAM